MKLHSFIYLEEIPPDTEGQETASLSADEIMDIIYHSMPTTSKNKMIEQGFNYAETTIKEMTDFFEARVENLEPKEDKKKSSAAAKKSKKAYKKRKREDSDSSVVEASEESTKTRRTNKNIASYTVNTFILRTVASILVHAQNMKCTFLHEIIFYLIAVTQLFRSFFYIIFRFATLFFILLHYFIFTYYYFSLTYIMFLLAFFSYVMCFFIPFLLYYISCMYRF